MTTLPLRLVSRVLALKGCSPGKVIAVYNIVLAPIAVIGSALILLGHVVVGAVVLGSSPLTAFVLSYVLLRPACRRGR